MAKPQEKKRVSCTDAFQQFRHTSLYSIILLVLFLAGSSGFTLYNKWMFSILKFDAPLFMTMTHMAAGFVGTLILSLIHLVTGCGYSPSRLDPKENNWAVFLLYAGIFAAKLCFANQSLAYLSVPENQVVQSTTPFFTYIAAFFIEKKTTSWSQTGCLFGIVGGAVMVLATTPKFNIPGYSFGFASVLMAALSLNLTSLFKSKMKINAVDITFYTAPLCMVMILPFVFTAHENDIVVDQFHHHPPEFVILLLIFSGLVAFVYNIIRNEFVHCSSSVFTSSASNFKVVITIVSSELLLQSTHLEVIQISGLAIVCTSFFALGYLEKVGKDRASVSVKAIGTDDVNQKKRL